MNPPDEIHGVSQGYFSVARYYGGCTFQGEHYTYFPTEDKLVRTSLLKQREKEAKKAKREVAKKKKEKKPNDLF